MATVFTCPPLVHTKANLGGGVWRLRWHPRDSELLLAACMYNGVAIVRMSPPWSHPTSLEVVTAYHEHQSIAYGADWHQQPEDLPGGSDLVATCSFYDRSLHVWTPIIA